MASFARRPLSRLIKPGDITKELQEKTTQFHGTFHGLKISNCVSLKVILEEKTKGFQFFCKVHFSWVSKFVLLYSENRYRCQCDVSDIFDLVNNPSNDIQSSLSIAKKMSAIRRCPL